MSISVKPDNYVSGAYGFATHGPGNNCVIHKVYIGIFSLQKVRTHARVLYLNLNEWSKFCMISSLI